MALTRREHEILALLASGRSTKELAKDLCISEHTAAQHRKHICQKLDIHSTAQLIAYAATHLVDSVARRGVRKK